MYLLSVFHATIRFFMFFRLVCYTAVFSVGALRYDTKNGCVADWVPPPECTSLYFVIKPFVHNYVS